jgi:hypothetical protein
MSKGEVQPGCMRYLYLQCMQLCKTVAPALRAVNGCHTARCLVGMTHRFCVPADAIHISLAWHGMAWQQVNCKASYVCQNTSCLTWALARRCWTIRSGGSLLVILQRLVGLTCLLHPAELVVICHTNTARRRGKSWRLTATKAAYRKASKILVCVLSRTESTHPHSSESCLFCCCVRPRIHVCRCNLVRHHTLGAVALDSSYQVR